MADKLLKEYEIESEGVKIGVKVVFREGEFVRSYLLDIPEYGPGTKALLESLKQSIIMDSTIKAERLLDPKFIGSLKQQFRDKAEIILKKELPQIDDETKNALTGILLHDVLGLGKIEFLLSDGNLEEIVINNSKEPVSVYHKEFGWLRTNILIETEEEIQNYANIIARRGGKQITILSPLLDTHLVTGDRANATLFPISSKGNTITIRRFRRDPWTVTDFIKNKTVNSEVMALIWMCMQYELNIVLSGGTASGKTSLLNVCLVFIQPNH
ncbi:MAG: ATPase, T2SS/T4P/T4SS family, partial [archaeon]